MIGDKPLLFTHQARNALWHVFTYLRDRFGAERVWVPGYICKQVIRPIHASGLKVLFADNRLDTLGIELPESQVQSGDIVIWPNLFGLSAGPIPTFPGRTVFVVEDNASSFSAPSNRADFTVFSFGAGKDLSSCEGGLVVVNRSEFADFPAHSQLRPPGFRHEGLQLWRYAAWKLKTCPPIYWLGKRVKTELRARKRTREISPVVGGCFQVRRVLDHNDLAMCSISLRMAGLVVHRLNELRERARTVLLAVRQRLEHLPGVRVLAPAGDSTFFCLNLLLEKRAAVMCELERRGIFLSVPWSYVVSELVAGVRPANSMRLRDQIAQIMIDPLRMDVQDAHWIGARFAESVFSGCAAQSVT